MKKQADNLVNSLDVISGRMSQLELYCYKLERSIGELRSDVMDYHSEANLNFRGLDKNVKEVCLALHRHRDTQLLDFDCQIIICRFLGVACKILVSSSKCIKT